MNKTKRILLIGLPLFLVLLLGIYLMGPKPGIPQFNDQWPDLTTDLIELEQMVNQKEQNLIGIKVDNQARILWADPENPQKTRYSLVYLHGFSASQGEGQPIHSHLAKRYGLNLYLSRLTQHGLENEEAFNMLSADDLFQSAVEALAIGSALGDSVILMGTSTGAALAIQLAARYPQVASLLLYSPIIDFYSEASSVLNKPWGLQIGRRVNGSEYMHFPAEDSAHSNYWNLKYRMEGLVALKNYIAHSMVPETFEQVKQPVFMAYYYKNEEEQDKVVSVPAMLKMYDQLGSPESKKRKQAFPEAGNHVIGSIYRSNAWLEVQEASEEFLEEMMPLEPEALPAQPYFETL